MARAMLISGPFAANARDRERERERAQPEVKSMNYILVFMFFFSLSSRNHITKRHERREGGRIFSLLWCKTVPFHMSLLTH